MNPFKQTSLKIRGSILLLALIITGGYILYDLHFKPPIAYALKDINVYSQPSMSSKIIGSLAIGNRIKITRENKDDNWYHIKSRKSSARKGFVRSNDIAAPADIKLKEIKRQFTAQSNILAYKLPQADFGVAFKILKGETVQVIGVTDDPDYPVLFSGKSAVERNGVRAFLEPAKITFSWGHNSSFPQDGEIQMDQQDQIFVPINQTVETTLGNIHSFTVNFQNSLSQYSDIGHHVINADGMETNVVLQPCTNHPVYAREATQEIRKEVKEEIKWVKK